MGNTLPYRPLTSLPLPLDSLFFALRVNPELACGDMASFGDARGLPLLSILSPSEADGLLESSALPRSPSLVSPGSSFCPFPGEQTGTGRDRLSWMDLLFLRGDSCSSSSSASWRNKTNHLRQYQEEGIAAIYTSAIPHLWLANVWRCAINTCNTIFELKSVSVKNYSVQKHNIF